MQQPENVTSRLEEAEQPKWLAKELRLLAKTKKQKVTPAKFPTIQQAARVQQEAQRLSLSLDTRDGFLAVLHTILKSRAEEEERAAKTDLWPVGTIDDWTRHRVANPAIALLGLTPATGSKGIEDRRAAAAITRNRKQNIIPRTLKNENHEPVIWEEVAMLLADRSPLERGPAVTLEVFRQPSPPDFDAEVDKLSKQEVRRLAVEFVQGYREFERELSSLIDSFRPWSLRFKRMAELGRAWGLSSAEDLLDIDLPPELDEPSYDDERFFQSLHAFANLRLDNEFLLHMLDALSRNERDTPISRFAWLARIFEVLHYHFIAFGPRGWALLNHAAERADGNFHVFLEVMEGTEYGRELLQGWVSEFKPPSGTPQKIRLAHERWLMGLALARLLVAPVQIRENQREFLLQWILSDSDFMESGDTASFPQLAEQTWHLGFEEGTYEIAFLKACSG
jgi:hypothetical protein